MNKSDGSSVGLFVTEDAGPGAGGWVTGIDAADDGTLMARTDTNGCYILPPSRTGGWQQQVVPGTTVSFADFEDNHANAFWWSAGGTYDAAIAPSDSRARAYVQRKKVFSKKADSSVYVPWSLPPVSVAEPNATERMTGDMLAYHPTNPLVIFFASEDGLFKTSDGGDNWSMVPLGTLPKPVGGRASVAFDRSTGHIFYAAYGVPDVYRSQDGGTTWATIAQPPSPGVFSHLKVAPDTGKVYLAGGGGENDAPLRIWTPGTNSWFTAPTSGKTVALSRLYPGRVYSTTMYGGYDVSTDGGQTFATAGNAPSGARRIAGDIDWHTVAGTSLANGDTVEDPLTNRLWVADGIGVSYVDSPPLTANFNQTVTWTALARGIENMVMQLGRFNPLGDFAAAQQDRGYMVFPNGTLGRKFAATYGSDTTFQHGTGLDFAPEDPNFWVGVGFKNNNDGKGWRHAGWSDDGGATWHAEDGLAAATGYVAGGQIAVLSKDVWLAVQSNGDPDNTSDPNKNGVWRAIDRGKTWELTTLGNNSIYANGPYFRSQTNLVADKHNPGVAYVLTSVDTVTAGANNGVWKTTDWGVTWAKVRGPVGNNPGDDFWAPQLFQVSATEWLYGSGPDRNSGLKRSTDGMVTWTSIGGTDPFGGTGFQEVVTFGVGRPKPGSAFPTMLVAGVRDGTAAAHGFDYWFSEDGGASWQPQGAYVGGPAVPRFIAGDPTRYGVFVIGTNIAGMRTWKYTSPGLFK